MFKKAKDGKLYEEVVRQIRSRISEGTYKPGDLLPSEEELAKAIGVSRVTVREGLRVLEIVGIVETRRGKGTVVTAITPEVIQERLSIAAIPESISSVYSLMQVRELLEPELARLAASEADSRDLEKIENVLEEMKKDIAVGGTGEASSLDFHFAIINSIDNPVLTYIMTTIIDLQKESRSITLTIPGRPDVALNEHEKIFKAIKERKGEDAAFHMKVHLNNTKESLEKIYPNS